MKETASNVVVLGRPVAAPEAATVRWAVPATQGSAHLTPRQLQVLALLCEGLPNKLICRRLKIATGTVKVHIGCILRVLGVTSRLQAVVQARSRGLHMLATFDAPEEDSPHPARARSGTGSGTIGIGM